MATEEINKKISLLSKDLAALENYVRDIFTFSPLPLCFISPLGVILEANPAFVKISKFSLDEIIGMPVEKVFKEKDIMLLAQETVEKGFVEGKEMIFFPATKIETPTQVFTRARKDDDGNFMGYFLSIFDLSEIKKREKELQIKIEELEKFHTISVGRELKMIELKKEIEKLKKEIERLKNNLSQK